MRKKNLINEVMSIFGYAVSVMFVVLGFYLIFASSLNSTTMPKELRTIMGGVLVTYGLFRSVINYQKHHQRNDDEDEE